MFQLFESVDEMLKCSNSLKKYAFTVYYLVPGIYNFQFLDELFSDNSNGNDMFNDSVSFPVFVWPNLTCKLSTHTILRSSVTFIYPKNPELMSIDETREER